MDIDLGNFELNFDMEGLELEEIDEPVTTNIKDLHSYIKSKRSINTEKKTMLEGEKFRI
jgi:hypothetical protein